MERRIHHQRRKGVLDGVARDAINPRGYIDLPNPIRVGKGVRGNLARSCLFALGGRSKGEYAARANGQHPADTSLITHAEAENVNHATMEFEKTLYHDVL